jgi:hypothetical protein
MDDARSALMATVVLTVLLPLSGQEASPIKAKDIRQEVGQLRSVSFSFDSQVAPVAKNMLEELKDVSITIATSGRPVLVAILPENTSNVNADPFAIVLTAKNISSWMITILREDGFQVASFFQQSSRFKAPDVYLEIPFSLNAIDTPGPGSHTYTVRMQSQSVEGRCQIKGARLVAYEL